MILIAAPLLFFIQNCGSSGLRRETDTAAGATGGGAPKADFTADAWRWADSIVSGMTLEMKAGQVVMPALYSRSDPSTMEALRYYADSLRVGGVVLLKGNASSARKISTFLYSGDRIPPFVSIDAEWGLGMRLLDAPEFPKNGRIWRDADENMMYEYGAEVARECRVAGINMVLGPVLDVLESGKRESAIGIRSFGDDPVRVSSLGVAYSRGIEDGNVISVAKHFPGHGSAVADSHKSLPRLNRSLKEMRVVDLTPFRDYIHEGLSGIMVGHLSVPSMDSVDRPAAFSPVIIYHWLRDTMGFDGLILTDALSMGGSSGFTGADAIAAGADMVLAPDDTRRTILEILAGVESGRLSELALRDRCRRILFYKYIVARKISSTERGESLSDQRAERIAKRLSGK